MDRNIEARLENKISEHLNSAVASLYFLDVNLRGVQSADDLDYDTIGDELSKLTSKTVLPQTRQLTDRVAFREAEGAESTQVIPWIQMPTDQVPSSELRGLFNRCTESANRALSGYNDADRIYALLIGDSGLVDPTTAQTGEFCSTLQRWFGALPRDQRSNIDCFWANPGTPIGTGGTDRIVVSKTRYQDRPSELPIPPVWTSDAFHL